MDPEPDLEPDLDPDPDPNINPGPNINLNPNLNPDLVREDFRTPIFFPIDYLASSHKLQRKIRARMPEIFIAPKGKRTSTLETQNLI